MNKQFVFCFRINDSWPKDLTFNCWSILSRMALLSFARTCSSVSSLTSRGSIKWGKFSCFDSNFSGCWTGLSCPFKTSSISVSVMTLLSRWRIHKSMRISSGMSFKLSGTISSISFLGTMSNSFSTKCCLLHTKDSSVANSTLRSSSSNVHLLMIDVDELLSGLLEVSLVVVVMVFLN